LSILAHMLVDAFDAGEGLGGGLRVILTKALEE
jgi:hypothetical protein